MSAETQVNTVKGHGLKVGNRFNFHGMASDLPTDQGTQVELGKVGNKYMLTTVAGEIMTWEFGASAKFHADLSPAGADASDIAEGIAQAWCEAGSPRDEAGRPVVVAAESVVLPVVGQWIMWQGFSYMVESRYSDGRMNLKPHHDYTTVTPVRPIAQLMEWGEVKWPNLNCVNCGPQLTPRCIRCTPCDTWGRKTGEPPLAPPATDADMRAFILAYVDASGESADEYDVNAIVDQAQAELGTIDLGTIPGEQFSRLMEAGRRDDTPALPVRTPGHALAATLPDDAWALMEAAIWAGTDQVVRMRFPRKMKKAMRNQSDARRPIDVKRSRIAKGW